MSDSEQAPAKSSTRQKPVAPGSSDKKLTIPFVTTVLAVISVAFAVLIGITVSTRSGGDGSELYIPIFSAMMALVNDIGYLFNNLIDGDLSITYILFIFSNMVVPVLRIAMPIIVLVLLCIQNKKTQTLMVVPLALGLAVSIFSTEAMDSIFAPIYALILDPIYALSEPSIILYFFLSILIYGGALAVYIVGLVTKKNRGMIVLIGLGVITVISLALMLAGQPPFGRFVEAYTSSSLHSSSSDRPAYSVFYLSRFLSMACMWASIGLYALAAFGKGYVPIIPRRKHAPTPASAKEQLCDLEELVKFKELLDAGIITSDDYEAKKKELLDLKPNTSSNRG